MASPITDKEKSDLPSPKRQKTEEEEEEEEEEKIVTSEESDNPYDSDDFDDEEVHRFNEECRKSEGFGMDFSKFQYHFGWKQMNLKGKSFAEGHKSNKDFVAMLVNLALTEHNEGRDPKLKLDKILRTNFHISTGATYYISFQVIDPADNQILPYRAVVRYFPGDIEVVSCNPKPSS